ncbi:MAG: DUF4367 domain-containing protein [Eubacterium sp.]|nr:DUF4367 domain-containing protein [Eubacterium sp.]
MTDKEFDRALELAIQNYGDSFFDLPDGAETLHIFSEEFELKMQKLIAKERKFYFPLIKTRRRKILTAAVITAIIAATMVMSIGALREPVIGFFTNMFSTHAEVLPFDTVGAPETIEDIYEIAYIPDGFELAKRTESLTYISEYYEKADGHIVFNQEIKSKYKENVNTEGYDMLPIEVNENNGFIIDMDGYFYIVWDNGDYIFSLETGSVVKNTLIEMAKSVQKAE